MAKIDIKLFFSRALNFRPQKRWLITKYSVFKLRQQQRHKGKAAIKLEVGCGDNINKGWLPSDYKSLDITNQKNWDRFFVKNQLEAILAEHVWEHLTPEAALVATKNCYEYLKPGGYLRVAVPDGGHPDPRVIDMIKPGGTGGGAYDHKVLYTYKTFSDLFKQVGFEVKLLEYFDSKGVFIVNAWSERDGFVARTFHHTQDKRDIALKNYSILLDAIKPQSPISSNQCSTPHQSQSSAAS